MGTIDLTNQPAIKTNWIKDDITGNITIQFFNDAEDTLLGEFIVESRKFRSIDEVISEVGRSFLPDEDSATFKGHRTVFKSKNVQARTEFDV